MSKWETVRLIDVCKCIFAGGDVPKDNYSLERDDFYSIPIYTNGEQNIGLYGYTTKARVNEPSITVSARGTIGFTAIRTTPFYPAIRLITLTPNERIDIQYLYYVTKNYKFDNGGTSIPQLTVPMLKNYSFPLPDLETQRKIATTLDKVTHTIDLCNAILEKLDLLVKSRFVEMFGDYNSNPNKYKIEALEKHIDLLSGYPFESSQYTDEGVNICGGLIIMPQFIRWDDCKHWKSIIGYEQYVLEKNDIVMALDRPWINEGFKVAKVDSTHLPALLIQRTARIRAIDINQDYLFYCFLNCGFDIHCNVTGSLVPHISAKDIKKFQIMLPPIGLQNQFAAFVEQTDKSKLAVKKVLEKAETLKKALMQEYFG